MVMLLATATVILILLMLVAFLRLCKRLAGTEIGEGLLELGLGLALLAFVFWFYR